MHPFCDRLRVSIQCTGLSCVAPESAAELVSSPTVFVSDLEINKVLNSTYVKLLDYLLHGYWLQPKVGVPLLRHADVVRSHVLRRRYEEEGILW